jgi:hypothetical protein
VDLPPTSMDDTLSAPRMTFDCLFTPSIDHHDCSWE